jgi:hypothetical protein
MTRASPSTHNFRDNKNRAIIAFDRRAVRRQRVLKEARIILSNGRSTMSCVVRDISEKGARLQASFTPDVPEIFMLLIPGEGTMIKARRMWLAGNQMGVRFISAPEPGPTTKPSR